MTIGADISLYQFIVGIARFQKKGKRPEVKYEGWPDRPTHLEPDEHNNVICEIPTHFLIPL